MKDGLKGFYDAINLLNQLLLSFNERFKEQIIP
jgi:hypothetical protein